MSYDELISKHHEALCEAQEERWPEVVSRYELESAVPQGPTDALLDGLIQKAAVVLVKKKLDENPALNQQFAAQVKNPLLQQLLTAARIKELSRARIVKKGGRKKLAYDVTDLRATFYGKQLLKTAGLGDRQRVLDKDELEKLNETCAKVKLVLPETVEPTATERFFES
jgi:hypothetical protein